MPLRPRSVRSLFKRVERDSASLVGEGVEVCRCDAGGVYEDHFSGDGLVCRAGGDDALGHDHSVFLGPDTDVIHLLAARVAAPTTREKNGVIVGGVEVPV